MQDLWTTVVDTLIGVLPIVGFLLFVQLVILRVPLANPRQIFIGIVCSIVGLTLFSQGLKLGLLPLGEEAVRTCRELARCGCSHRRLYNGLRGYSSRACVAFFGTAGGGV